MQSGMCSREEKKGEKEAGKRCESRERRQDEGKRKAKWKALWSKKGIVELTRDALVIAP